MKYVDLNKTNSYSDMDSEWTMWTDYITAVTELINCIHLTEINGIMETSTMHNVHMFL